MYFLDFIALSEKQAFKNNHCEKFNCSFCTIYTFSHYEITSCRYQSEMMEMTTHFAMQSAAECQINRRINQHALNRRLGILVKRVLIPDPALRFYNHTAISQTQRRSLFPLAKHHEALSTRIGYCRGNNNRPGRLLR